MSELTKALAEEVLPDAPWEAIAPHYARGVVILVTGLDLAVVGAALARDDVPAVEAWLAEGALRRPDDADARAWNEAQPTFDMLVIQPWILIRSTT